MARFSQNCDIKFAYIKKKQYLCTRFWSVPFLLPREECWCNDIPTEERSTIRSTLRAIYCEVVRVLVQAKGKMAEWSIASVLKTEVRKRTGGSNPSLSAKKNKKSICPNLFEQGDFLFFFEQGASGSLLGLRRNPSICVIQR